MKLPEIFRQLLAVTLCSILLTASVPVVQASPKLVGTIQFQGNVLINGSNSPANATVFSGDTVSVSGNPPTGWALLTTADGARIELRPNTSASFVAGASVTEVVLKQGAVLVQTRPKAGQATVMVEGLLARSVEKAPAFYEVARQEKRVDVTAGQGAVEITGLVSGSLTVPAGKRATLEARPEATGQGQPPAAGAGGSSYTAIPAWGWWLIALGAAGAITGIVLAVTGEESPSSR